MVGGSYPSAEMHSVYSTTPAELASMAEETMGFIPLPRVLAQKWTQ